MANRDDSTNSEQPERAVPLVDYRILYPGCAGGCGDLVDRPSALCYRCASEQARRLDVEARMRTRTTAP
jgi:hypothetical protein